MMPIPAPAFILVGGTSSRFGFPKWKANLRGKSLLDYALALCNPVFEKTYLVARRGQELAGRQVIFDLLEQKSPLVGIYSALMQSTCRWNFVLSCDLPLVNETVITELWGHVASSCEAIVPQSQAGIEPTCAFYSKSILPKCKKMITRKEYGLYRLIAASSAKLVDFSGRERFFMNINTPEDLQAAKTLLKKQSMAARGYRFS